MSSAHEVLGVAPGASEQEVRQAFRQFVRIYHPDAGGEAGMFEEGLRAYRQLTGQEVVARAPGNVVFYRKRSGLQASWAWLRDLSPRRRPPSSVH